MLRRQAERQTSEGRRLLFRDPNYFSTHCALRRLHPSRRVRESSTMNTLTRNLLHGVLPVLQTPFTDQGEIDRTVLVREIDWAFETGADGVVVAMVSEILRLGYRRRRELVELVCQAAQGRGFCVVSVGAESIAEAVEFARHAEEHRASAVMAIPPVATGLGDAATREYFAAIAGSISLPLVVQDASSYVGRCD